MKGEPMATLLDYCDLCDRGYDRQEPLVKGGFRCQRWDKADNEGFIGGIFEATDENLTIVAFAGTDFKSGNDLMADIRLGLGWLPKQAQRAMALVCAAKEVADGRHMVLTGHSLGGGLAQ